MRPVEFYEKNADVGKGQNEYSVLPAFQDGQETISKWRPSVKDRIKLLFGASVWHRQLTTDSSVQPIILQVSYPFEKKS